MPIEQSAPELEHIVSSGQSIDELGSGYGGDQGPQRGRCGGRREDTCCSATFTTTGG